jgi:conjugative relaxase-like TrwC/TraI family protein
MLSMTNVSGAGAASSYYSADNYYTADESRAASAWSGEGAKRLGLSGPVEVDDFRALLEGKVAGQELGRPVKNAEGELEWAHRPGFDVTLSAPKSVSILAEVFGDSEVRDAHEKAVDAVASYIESELINVRIRSGGEVEREKTGNAIFARFHHNTSRDLDPQTHTHLVLINASQ